MLTGCLTEGKLEGAIVIVMDRNRRLRLNEPDHLSAFDPTV